MLLFMDANAVDWKEKDMIEFIEIFLKKIQKMLAE